MKIVQVFQTKNPSYTKNRPIEPVGIFVHATGSANRNIKRYVDAEEILGKNQYGNHWNKADANKSVHAWIGYDKDQNVIVAQTLPYDRACWGAGKGDKGSYNYDPQAHIQFEICQGSNTDSEYYWKAIKVAEEYCAHLCREFGWTADQITSHYEAHAAGYASNHGDPRSWMVHFDDSMDKFRARVAALLGETAPAEPEVIPEAVPAPDPVQSAPATTGGGKTVMIELPTLRMGSRGAEVKTLQRLLTAHGYPCGAADGIYGNNTLAGVKAFQKAKKLAVDGIVGRDTWTALLK